MISLWLNEAYSEPCQTSKVVPFAKTFNYFKAITIFMKNTISDILQAGFWICFCKYTSTISKEHFLLLNIQINRNFQSCSVVRNSNKNEIIQQNHAKWIARSQMGFKGLTPKNYSMLYGCYCYIDVIKFS